MIRFIFHSNIKREKNPLVLKEKSRLVRSVPHGLTYYGTQYDNPKPGFLKTVQTIIKNPQF